MYFFEFHFGEKEVGTETVKFSVLLQSDTGCYDAINSGKTISGTDVDKFKSPEDAKTRLIFRANTKGRDELWHELWGEKENGEYNFSKDKNRWEIKNDNSNHLAIAYNLEEFINQDEADTIMDDFAKECSSVGISIGEVE